MKKYLKLKVFNLYGGAALTTDDENPFTCPVCLEQYDDKKRKPTTLLCGHSLCIACVTEIEQRSRGAVSGQYAGSGPPRCPLCREIIDMRYLMNKKPSISLMDGSVYLTKKVTNLEQEKSRLKYNLERDLRSERSRAERLEKRLNSLELEKEKPLVNTNNFTFLKNDKKIAAIAAPSLKRPAEEKPKLRYPEAENLKFKEEKRDMSKELYFDKEYNNNIQFNDTLAIKKYINENGLEEFQVGEYADKVTFDENGVEKREHIRIEHINFHGGVDIKTGLPNYGIVYKYPEGKYTSYTGSSNFIQFRIREDNAKLRKTVARDERAYQFDPEVYKFIQKISPIESARRAQAHKYANEKKTEFDSDEEDDY